MGDLGDPILRAERTDKAADIAAPGIEEVKAIAEEGFIYGLPIVMNYAVMNEYAINRDSGQFKAPFNEILNEHRVYTYKDTAIITPNSDTPYSLAWLDLRAEPIVLSVPPVDKNRYYSVMLNDGNTFNYGYIGSRATGNEAGDYIVAGPRWQGETPPGIKKVFRSTTDFSLAAYRTQLFDASDLDNVIKVQDGYKIQPLSAYLKQPAPPPAPTIDWPKIDEKMVKTNFFEYLDFALQFAPAATEEEAIRAKLATIGVGPGKKFDFEDLSLEHKAAVLLGMKEGESKVEKYLADRSKETKRVEHRLVVRRPRFLQRQLAAARRGSQGRNLRQRCHRGGVSHGQSPSGRRRSRRFEAQLHAHLREGRISPRKRVLVGDDVRRKDAVAHQESDRSVFDQLADAAEHE